MNDVYDLSFSLPLTLVMIVVVFDLYSSLIVFLAVLLPVLLELKEETIFLLILIFRGL